MSSLKPRFQVPSRLKNIRLRFATALFGLTISLVSQLSFAQLLDFRAVPPDLPRKFPANLVVTLDDSGSMGWGFMPAEIQGNWARSFYRSAHYNKLFYNPQNQYGPPLNSLGSVLPDASFSSAISGYFYSEPVPVVRDLNLDFSALYFHYEDGNILELDEAFSAVCVGCTSEPAYHFTYESAAIGCLGTEEEKRVNDLCYSKSVITDSSLYQLSQMGCPASTLALNSACRSLAQEKTNFANWYQYYSIRGDALKTALTHAFAPNNFSSDIRVARQAQNTFTVPHSGPSNANDNNPSLFDGNERDYFFQWFQSLPTNGGTVLRNSVFRAGEFFKLSENYKIDVNDITSPVIACRRNAHLLLTDGADNVGFTSPENFIRDDMATTLPDGLQYIPGADPIYNNSLDLESVADLAFHYWATDLLPSFQNLIEPRYFQGNGYWNPKNNPATWQHMTSTHFSFGSFGTVGTDEATYQQLLAGSLTWPATVSDQITGVDDLYHGAINGRGQFFSSNDPFKLVEVVRNLSDRLTEDNTVASRQSMRLLVGESGNVFITSFSPSSWSGDLDVYSVSDGSDYVEFATPSSCNENLLGTLCSPLWSAIDINSKGSAHMQPSVRSIFSYSNAAGLNSDPNGSGINFVWDASPGQNDALDLSQKATLDGSDGLGVQRVDYLRGDDSLEQQNGGDFRSRDFLYSPLGAVVHTSIKSVNNTASHYPIFDLQTPDDLEPQSYSQFAASISARTPMVYVGAGDGMLHGYNAGTDLAAGAGEEVFSYIPNELMDQLSLLTDPEFSQKAFVDGEIAVQDIYSDSAWSTLLVGGLRSGGQGIYVLNITNPEGGASSIVRWEFSDHNDADMGYSFGKPLIVRANNGQWVVIVANGYNSTEEDGRVGTGEAVLYILSAGTGALLKKVIVGDGNLANADGLVSPTVANDGDINNFPERLSGTDEDDFTADYIYAGSLKGKVWKFNISSTSENNWDVESLFYDAGTDHPITQPLSIGNLAVSDKSHLLGDARYVYFGTGKYNELFDIWVGDGRKIFGVVDDDQCYSVSTACVLASELVSQSVSVSQNLGTNNPQASLSKGWQLHLPYGEQLMESFFQLGSVLLFNTIKPEDELCDSSGDSYIYALDRFSGGHTAVQMLDLAPLPFSSDELLYSRIPLGGVTRGSSLYQPNGFSSEAVLIEPSVGVIPLTTSLDSDGDGLSDIIEVSLETYIDLIDTDGDGLTDYEELNWIGSPEVYSEGLEPDPLNPDTDQDGLLDGEDPSPLLAMEGETVPLLPLWAMICGLFLLAGIANRVKINH